MAVKIPFKIRPRLDMAPKFGLISIDRDVPIACAAFPMERLCAMGFFTFVSFIILYPNIAPNIPTTITTDAVSGAIPPMVFYTSMAMGVVTDLGAKE